MFPEKEKAQTTKSKHTNPTAASYREESLYRVQERRKQAVKRTYTPDYSHTAEVEQAGSVSCAERDRRNETRKKEGETSGLVGSARGDVLLDDALDVIAERDEAHGTPHSERDARGHAAEQAADAVLAVDVPRGGEDRRRLNFGRSRGLRGGRSRSRGTGEGGGTVRGGRDDARGGDRGGSRRERLHLDADHFERVVPASESAA